MNHQKQTSDYGRQINTVEFLQTYREMCNEDESVDSVLTRRQVFDLILDKHVMDEDYDYLMTA